MIEKTIQKTYWYSDDGFEFSDKDACIKYEERKKIAEEAAKMPYIHIPWPSELDSGRTARVYILHTEADFQFLTKYLSWYKNDMQEVLPPGNIPLPVLRRRPRNPFSHRIPDHETTFLRSHYLLRNH